MFLKIDGVQGESKSPRHLGEIELSAVMWGVKHQNSFGGPVGRGKILANDLTVSKRTDNTSPILMRACATGQNFGEGILTIEKLSPAGGVLQSVIVELMSILVDSFTSENSIDGGGVAETIALNCGNLKLVR